MKYVIAFDTGKRLYFVFVFRIKEKNNFILFTHQEHSHDKVYWTRIQRRLTQESYNNISSRWVYVYSVMYIKEAVTMTKQHLDEKHEPMKNEKSSNFSLILFIWKHWCVFLYYILHKQNRLTKKQNLCFQRVFGAMRTIHYMYVEHIITILKSTSIF